MACRVGHTIPMTGGPQPPLGTVTRHLHLPVTSCKSAFLKSSGDAKRLVVAIDEPRALHRSRLADFVAERVDQALARRGACPASQGTNDLERRLLDGIYRARLLGWTGLALDIGDLSALSGEGGELCATDSSTLRRLLALAENQPLQLHLSSTTAALRVLDAARPLSEWLSPGALEGRIAGIECAAPSSGGENADRDSRSVDGRITARSAVLSPPLVSAFTRSGSANAPESAVVAAPVERQKECDSWARELASMKGPKVHSTVERAFANAYVPLCHQAAAGAAPEQAWSVAQGWARGFARSYASAQRKLGGQKPRSKMVRDVVDVSARWLGRYGARRCQILVVRGMRFDLGQRLNQAIEEGLGGRGTFADQTLLWAALPTGSDPQADGGDAMGGAPQQSSPPLEGATTPSGDVDEIQIGSRSMYRLDCIASDLSRPGEPQSERLDRLATKLAKRVLPWMQQQPRDTLVVVFGDQGFHWQATPHGTGPAQCGGPLPEQVLVPASGWLLASRSKTAVAPPLLH